MASTAEARTRVGGWRESPWLAVGELVLVVVLVVADIHRLVPFSKTPFYLVLGWVSLHLRGVGWRGVGFTIATRRNLVVPIVSHGVSNSLAFVLIYLGRYPSL
jgi:hypothetical protein